MESGATDGYFGKWVPDSGCFTGRIETKASPVTFTMNRTMEGWIWICNRCNETIRTADYRRPKHTCLDKQIEV